MQLGTLIFFEQFFSKKIKLTILHFISTFIREKYGFCTQKGIVISILKTLKKTKIALMFAKINNIVCNLFTLNKTYD